MRKASYTVGPLREPAQPLVLQPAPYSDESLIGLVARATRENVLEATGAILAQVGLYNAPAARVVRTALTAKHDLATILGCRTRDIEDRCYPPASHEGHPQEVQFGDARILKSELNLTRRRISPLSVRAKPYHRAIWMCRLITHCPETLELLIDECPNCNSPLGWIRSWGIGECEYCRQEIVSSHPSFLRPDLHDGYRLFANLISPVRSVRRSALDRVPLAVAGLPPSDLLHLLIQLGCICRQDRIALRRQIIPQVGSNILPTIVARGSVMLSGWPASIEDWVDAEVARLGRSDFSTLKPLLSDLRRLGMPRTAPPAQMKLVRSTLPDLFVHVNRAFSGRGSGRVLGNEACRIAGISAAELRGLREAKLVRFDMRLAAKGRTRVQYEASEISEIAHRRGASVFISKIEQRLGLPRYAIEQMICAGLLDYEAHPVILHLEETPRVTRSSATALLDALLQRCRRSDPAPRSAISLRQASRIVGGRCKPWASIATGILNGSVACWASGNPGKFISQTLVQLKDLHPFQGISDPETNSKFEASAVVSQIDACEILNIDACQIRAPVREGLIQFRPRGVALVASKPEILRLSCLTISAGEAAARLGASWRHVRRYLNRLNAIEQKTFGWSRHDFERYFMLTPRQWPPTRAARR